MGKPIAKTALKGLMAKVSARGMSALDGRSAGFKALALWREQLIADLGGDVSTQELALVEIITRTKLFLDSIDLFLMEQDSLVNKKSRVAYPVLQTRNAMASTLANLLNQIGLKRRAKPMKSLAEFLLEKESVTEDYSIKAGENEHSRDDGASETVPENLQVQDEEVG
jgi:hypothetical protein